MAKGPIEKYILRIVFIKWLRLSNPEKTPIEFLLFWKFRWIEIYKGKTVIKHSW